MMMLMLMSTLLVVVVMVILSAGERVGSGAGGRRNRHGMLPLAFYLQQPFVSLMA